jgi:hypothetical protein
MLWGSGRLLLRALSVARSGVRRRLLPFARSHRAVSAVTALAVLAPLALLIHPGATPQPRRGELPRALEGTGTVSVDAPDAAVNVPFVPGGRRPSPGSRPAVKPSNRFALLVGINHAAGGSPLEGAVTDALNVKQALLGYGFPEGNVTTLLDAQATRAAILQGLDDLARRTPASGVAVLLIASHSRQHNGIDQILAADGARVDSTEIAARMKKVRSRAWIALPTCFAGGYALPGIVGPGRVATFASSAGSESYEVGRPGSYLIIDMVQEAMIEQKAPYSVESAFEYAQQKLERTHPNRVPSMSDGVPGDLVLGDVPAARAADASPASTPPPPAKAQWQPAAPEGADPPEPSDTPAPPSNGRRMSVQVCGKYSNWNCSSR